MLARIRHIWQYLKFKKPSKILQIVVDEDRPEECKCDESLTTVPPFRKKKLVLIWEMEQELLVYPSAKYDSRFFTAYALNDRHKRINGTFAYGPYQVGNKFPTAGFHDIFVTFLPADNLYEAITSYKTIYIGQDTPVLLWTLPSDYIDYGNPLTSNYFQASTQHGDHSMIYSHLQDCILDMGTHVLTATYTPTGLNAINYKGVTITREITIKGAPTSLSWGDLHGLYSPDAINMYPFTITSEHYQGIIINDWPQLPGEFHYSPPVGSIVDAGIAVLRVKFTPTDSIRFLPCGTTRELKVDRATPVLHWSSPILIYENYSLDDDVLCCTTSTTILNKLIRHSNTPLPGTFVYNPPLGTKLKELGPVTIICEFIPQDTKNYISTFAEISTKVLKGKPPLIDWPTPDSLVHPQPLTKLELNAKVKGCYPGDFVYDPPIGTVLDVGKHELKVKFLSKTVGKTDCFGSAVIEVTVGSPLLTWDKPFDIIEGVPLTEVQLNCRCSNVREGEFIYDPPKGVRLKKGLNRVLKVTFLPAGVDRDNFTSGSLMQTLNVTYKGKKMPRIEFPTPPGPIRFPAPITLETHLKAVCLDDLPGKFQYLPAPDSILDVGDNFIAVEFLPSDNMNWSRIRRGTWITVLPATPHLIWKSSPFINFKEPLGVEHCDVKAILPVEDTNGGTDDETVLGRFYFDPPIGTILDAGVHAVTCRFEPYGKNYVPVEKQDNVIVSRCYPRLEWLPPPEPSNPNTFPYYVKKMLHLRAKCVYPLNDREIGEAEAKPIDGKFEYSHKDGDLLNAGETTLTVLFLPVDTINMYSATASIKLLVAKKTPIIYWDKPFVNNGNLQYGKKVTKAHVSVSVIEIEGTFVINYPVGYVFPHTGEYSLIASFTPSEQYQNNYATATIERKVTVTSKRLFLAWVVPPGKGRQEKISYVDLVDIRLLQEKFGAKILEDNLSSFDKRNLGISGSRVCGRFEYMFPSKAARDQVIAVTYTLPPEYKDDYYSFVIERTVNVTAVRPELTWSIPLKERTLPYGLPITRENILKCKCQTYTGTVVFENGIVGSTPSLGRYQAHARFVPSYAQYQNNVLVVRSSIGFTITKAMPKIIWEPVKHVPYGYVLSAKDFAATAMRPYQADNEDVGPDDGGDYCVNDAHAIVRDTMRTVLENVCIDEEVPCRMKEKIIEPNGIFVKYTPELGTVLTTKRNVLTMQFIPQGPAMYHYRKVTLIREIYIDDKKYNVKY